MQSAFIRTHNELAPNGDLRAGALWNEFARQSAERGQRTNSLSEKRATQGQRYGHQPFWDGVRDLIMWRASASRVSN
jgi:hypothetical protein